jgi:hypothetical protein
MPSPVTTASSSGPTRPRVEAFLARVNPVRGRLIFALDATASRQPTWDTAAQRQAEMFETVANIGGLDVQLVYYRGWRECVASRWLSDAKSLTGIMSDVMCSAGHTQIGRVLNHARKEHQQKKVDALILISDACEETPADLYAEARELGVPAFMFQEGDNDQIAGIYAEIANLTGGASCRFDAGAAQRLADHRVVIFLVFYHQNAIRQRSWAFLQAPMPALCACTHKSAFYKRFMSASLQEQSNCELTRCANATLPTNHQPRPQGRRRSLADLNEAGRGPIFEECRTMLAGVVASGRECLQRLRSIAAVERQQTLSTQPMNFWQIKADSGFVDHCDRAVKMREAIRGTSSS